jgi:hypothetical protein
VPGRDSRFQRQVQLAEAGRLAALPHQRSRVAA